MRTLAILAFALAPSACAQNAVLELQVELPAILATDPPRFAKIEVVRADSTGFDAVWTGSDLRGLELGDARQRDCISVQTTDDSVDVNVRVRFCRGPTCGEFGDDTAPESRFRLEHPFYLGRHTYWSAEIAAIPECGSDADCPTGRCFDGACGCTTEADCCTGEGCRCPDPPCFTCEAGGCVDQIGRCHIVGCVVGDPPSRFCGGDGRHFCETGSFDRVQAYQCARRD